jgi:hypothetical protein
MLEHISLSEMRNALKNIHMMLKKGGIFRLIVPSIETRIMEYLIHRDANRFVAETGLGVKQGSNRILPRIRRAFANSGHRWMYDLQSMSAELASAGFVNIRECDFGDCEDPLFAEVEDFGRFYKHATRRPEEKEVCLECRK